MELKSIESTNGKDLHNGSVLSRELAPLPMGVAGVGMTHHHCPHRGHNCRPDHGGLRRVGYLGFPGDLNEHH